MNLYDGRWQPWAKISDERFQVLLTTLREALALSDAARLTGSTLLRVSTTWSDMQGHPGYGIRTTVSSRAATVDNWAPRVSTDTRPK